MENYFWFWYFFNFRLRGHRYSKYSKKAPLDAHFVRVAGIGPASYAWEAHVLPLYYTRHSSKLRRSKARFRPSYTFYRNTSAIVDQKPFSGEEEVAMTCSSSISIDIDSPSLTTLNFCLISSSTPLSVPRRSIPDFI